MTTELLGTYRSDGSDSIGSNWSRIGRYAVSFGATVHHVHSTNRPVNLTNITLVLSATTFPEHQPEGRMSVLFLLPCPRYCSDYVRSLILFSIHVTEESPSVWRHSHFEKETPPTDVARNGNDCVSQRFDRLISQVF